MKKLMFVFGALFLSLSTFSVSAKESFVNKTHEWWKQATPEIIEDMIKNGADVNEIVEIPVKTKASDSWKVLKELAQSEKDKMLIDETVHELENGVSHKSPILMMAIKFNTNPKVIESLIKNGANVNAKNSVGHSVLMCAAEYNTNPEMIETLIKYGADIHTKLETGTTALTIAACRNNNPEIIKTLIKHGAD